MVLTDDEAVAERGPPAALARHDLRHLGPPPRPRGLLRRRRHRLQLPPRRAARRARPRPAAEGRGARSSTGARWSAPTASGSAPTRCSTTSTVERASHFAFTVLFEDVETRVRVREALAAARIQTTRYPAVHRLTEFARYATRAPAQRRAAADRHLALPLSAHTTLEQVERGQLGRRRQQPVAHSLELGHRLLVVVVAAEVQPVRVRPVRAHVLAGRDQPQDQVREVQPHVRARCARARAGRTRRRPSTPRSRASASRCSPSPARSSRASSKCMTPSETSIVRVVVAIVAAAPACAVVGRSAPRSPCR